jgi:hypothetical protein
MNTGALQHLVTLDVPAGDHTFTPLDPPTWACAALEDATGTLTLSGRGHAGITTATRVHYQDRVYHVDAMRKLDGQDFELQLTCREVFDT